MILEWRRMSAMESQIIENSIVIKQIVQANNKESIEALHYWSLCWETTSNRWIHCTKVQQCGKYAYAVTSPCTV